MPPARRRHRKRALKFLRTRQRETEANKQSQFSGRALRWWSITSHLASPCLVGESEVLMRNLHPKPWHLSTRMTKTITTLQHLSRQCANGMGRVPVRRISLLFPIGCVIAAIQTMSAV